MPKKLTERLTLKVPDELKRDLYATAAAQDRTANWLANKLLQEGLARERTGPRVRKK